MLKPDGLFLTRTYIREEGETWTPEKAVQEYRKTGSKKPYYSWALRDMYLAAYDHENDYVVLGNIWVIAKDLHEKGLITDEEMDYHNLMGNEGRTFKLAIFLRKEYEDLVKQYFEIHETFNATEPYCLKLFPLHVLK